MSKESIRSPGGVENGDHANFARTFNVPVAENLYIIWSATQVLSRGIPFIFNSWIVRHLNEAD
ncbi:hypothetical protein BVC80_1739g39 [Macleaya cordata]|uniref:Uncharacterized protein n=1 Tax=Macleaya cordata TaxID=56857 RepID=A0A200Q7U7_MACCD|nr:hypothetical protein BVC80_1739g39 [Macleaya cordata]